MDKALFKKTLNVWLLLSILAIVNGIIRNAGYKPFLGDLLAHQISTIIFIPVIFIATFLFLGKTKISSVRDLFLTC